VSDLSAERAGEVAARVGGEVVAAEDALTTPCDVLAPCAVGGILDAESIPRLRCRIVAGAANNQLATFSDAHRLRELGILYAPDYVINAGGVVQLLGIEEFGWDAETLEARLRGIGDALGGLFARADAEGVTPVEAAERLVAERLAT
jgi:glutamate dehydrogenase/leucine dehydrogenase